MKRLFERFKSILKTPQFTAVAIRPDGIKEKVYLKLNDGNDQIDVSLIHSPFCLYPLIVGVKLEHDMIKNVKNFELVYSVCGASSKTVRSNRAAVMSTIYDKLVDINDESGLLLMRVKKSKLFQPNLIERNELTFALYLHYLKKGNRHTINFLNNFCAAYSYPRKVFLTAIKTETHFNIFPMDFVLHLPEKNILLLGLNENNSSLRQIFENKKMIIADVSPSEKKIVYGLADQHRKDVKEIKNLPYNFFASEFLNFPVPEFALGYKEVELVKHVKMGSHYLLVCNILNEKKVRPDEVFLYHVNSIHQLHLRKINLAYPVV